MKKDKFCFLFFVFVPFFSFSNELKVTDPHFNFEKGYLTEAALPHSLELLPPPPEKTSKAFMRDEEVRDGVRKLKNSDRWKSAKIDAEIKFPELADNFSTVMGFSINENNTPHIYTIMKRVLTDAGLSTYAAKNKYFRTRPFVLHSEGTCYPEQEIVLRSDGSYPSGHAAVGWALALILAEINPKNSNEILKKGIDFGDSRIICNAHWQSDVDAGRIMGSATVAKLHVNVDFLKDIEIAKKEAVLSLQSDNK